MEVEHEDRFYVYREGLGDIGEDWKQETSQTSPSGLDFAQQPVCFLTLATITIEQHYYHWWGGEYSDPTYLLIAKMKRLMRNMEDSTDEEDEVLSDSPSIN